MNSGTHFLLGPEVVAWVPHGSPLAGPALEVGSGLRTVEPNPDAGPVVLDAIACGDQIRVTVDGVPVGTPPGPDLVPLVEASFSHLSGSRTRDWAILHAAAVRWDGQVLILPAERRSGKSTLSLALGLAGAEYLGDDLLFLHYDEPSLMGFPKAVTLKEGSFALFPDAPTRQDPFRGPVRYLLPPRPLHGPIALDPSSARLVFPHYLADNTPRAVPLEPEIAALSLLQQAFGGVGVDRRLLSVVRRLTALRPVLLSYPSTEAALDLLRSLEPA